METDTSLVPIYVGVRLDDYPVHIRDCGPWNSMCWFQPHSSTPATVDRLRETLPTRSTSGQAGSDDQEGSRFRLWKWETIGGYSIERLSERTVRTTRVLESGRYRRDV